MIGFQIYVCFDGQGLDLNQCLMYDLLIAVIINPYVYCVAGDLIFALSSGFLLNQAIRIH